MKRPRSYWSPRLFVPALGECLASLGRGVERICAVALPITLVLTLWQLAHGQRDPVPLEEITCDCGLFDFDLPPDPPPTFVKRNFQTEPIGDQEIRNAMEGWSPDR